MQRICKSQTFGTARRPARWRDMGGKHIRMCTIQHGWKGSGFESRPALHGAYAVCANAISSPNRFKLAAGKDRKLWCDCHRQSEKSDSLRGAPPAGLSHGPAVIRSIGVVGNTADLHSAVAGSNPVCSSTIPRKYAIPYFRCGITSFLLVYNKPGRRMVRPGK